MKVMPKVLKNMVGSCCSLLTSRFGHTLVDLGSRSWSRLLAAATLGGLLAVGAIAQTRFIPARITQAVDDSRRITLRGNIHPLAQARYDRGTAPATLPAERIQLLLKRSAEQQADLDALLEDQQAAGSPSYHQWLTPEDYGNRFGLGDSDLQAVRSWLMQSGFLINQVNKGRTLIEFSGNVGQVEAAFHTEIHRFVVNGTEHWANVSEPEIPAALEPVVAGIASLHNFEPRLSLNVQPLANFNGGHGMAPADFAAIYNVQPLYQAGLDGTGITIGVVGRTQFNIQDVTDFRNLYGLKANPPEIIVNGTDPGSIQSEQAEAVLDATWAGAVAPGAKVKFIASATTTTTDALLLSTAYLVDNNLADVITESFNLCEQEATQAWLDTIKSLSEQAAAQGITFVVASGDGGSAGCDDPWTVNIASHPESVNAFASSAFTVAVGGTQFNDSSSSWNSLTGAAVGHIPEQIWNEACAQGATGCNKPSIAAGGGGVSTKVSRPSWQAGVTGIPAGAMRLLPDVSLAAAAHTPYLGCLNARCPNAPNVGWEGTSAGAPSFAGMMALINQKTHSRQGQPGYVLYRLAAKQDFSKCDGSGSSPSATCSFFDVTSGNNAVPGESSYGGKGPLYPAGVGYDMASGLGTVNAANLANNWTSVTFSPSTTTLSITPAAPTAGNSVTINVQVASKTGTGKPTGDISLITNNGLDLAGFTLSGGSLVTTTDVLPSGAYTVYAHYPGDGTYAPSDSASVSVTVTGPKVSIHPDSLDFGTQSLGVVGASKTLTLSNQGSAPLKTLSVGINGSAWSDFQQVNNCGSTLAAGASCTITVSFKPAYSGRRDGAVNFADSATGSWGIAPDTMFVCGGSPLLRNCSPQNIPVTGTGVAPNISVTPGSINFGSVALGSSSAPQPIQIANTGAGDMVGMSILTTGANASDFTPASNCGVGPAAHSSCTVSVTFRPGASGLRSASFTLSYTGGSPQTVALSGTGSTGAKPTLSPPSIAFATTSVGSTAAVQYATLTNSGSTPFTGFTIALAGTNPGDFSISNNCGTTLAASASCSVGVVFKPAVIGTRAANLVISYTGASIATALSGSGVPAPKPILSSAAVNFGSVTVGAASTPQSMMLTNSGGSALSGISISLAGANPADFITTNTCSSALGAGASCTISVTFHPTATGSRSANLNVGYVNGSLTTSLSGTGLGVAKATLSTASLGFGSVNLGSTSTPQTITLSNAGSAQLTSISVTLTGPNPGDFTVTNNCGTALNVGASCILSVTFHPGTAGSRGASLNVSSNAAGSPQTVILSGAGAGTPKAALSIGSVNLGSVNVGSSSMTQPIGLTNTGTATLSSIAVAITGSNWPDFTQTNNCGSALNAGLSCTIWVTFRPGAAGSRTAILNVVSNAPGAQQTAALSGVGVAVKPTLSSVTPNPVKVNQTTTLTVNGSNFVSGLSVTVSTPTGVYSIAPVGITFVNANQVRVLVTMGGTPNYNATLTVTNPGGLAASAGFTVTR
jgi:hypothetical protein